MAVARLRAVMGLDSREFKAGIKGTKDETQSFTRTIRNVGAAIGVAFSAQAVLRMGRALVTWASDVSIAARNVGILTSEMLALNKVAIQSGLQTRDLQNLLARMETELFNAARGATELKAVYGDLGLTLDALFAEGMGPVERLQMVARAARDSGNMTANLAEIFGQRLGPNARVALESIAGGLEKVDERLGHQADWLEALGSRWAAYWEEARHGGMRFLAWLSDKHEEMTDYLGVTFARPGESEETIRDRVRAIRAARAAREQSARESRGKSSDRGAEDIRGMLSGLDQSAAESVRKEIQALADSKLEGLDKMDREHEIAMDAIRERMKTARDEEMDALFDLSVAAAASYQDNVRAFKDAEDEKIRIAKESAAEQERAARDRALAPITRERERIAEQQQSIVAGTRGVGAGGDAMARVGGFFGGDRAGLAVADKQLKVQREIEKLNRRLVELAEKEADVTGGDF